MWPVAEGRNIPDGAPGLAMLTSCRERAFIEAKPTLRCPQVESRKRVLCIERIDKVRSRWSNVDPWNDFGTAEELPGRRRVSHAEPTSGRTAVVWPTILREWSTLDRADGPYSVPGELDKPPRVSGEMVVRSRHVSRPFSTPSRRKILDASDDAKTVRSDIHDDPFSGKLASRYKLPADVVGMHGWSGQVSALPTGFELRTAGNLNTKS